MEQKGEYRNEEGDTGRAGAREYQRRKMERNGQFEVENFTGRNGT